MVDPRRMLAEEEAAWVSLRAAIDATDPSRRREPLVPPDGWSVLDAAVHVAWWLEECARVLEGIAAGTWDPATQPVETPSYVDRVNAAHVAGGRDLDWPAADRRLVEARDRARRAFEALSEPTADAWSWFEESGPLHYAKHEVDIRRFGGGGGEGR